MVDLLCAATPHQRCSGGRAIPRTQGCWWANRHFAPERSIARNRNFAAAVLDMQGALWINGHRPPPHYPRRHGS